MEKTTHRELIQFSSMSSPNVTGMSEAQEWASRQEQSGAPRRLHTGSNERRTNVTAWPAGQQSACQEVR
jgi:hypothetical protein